MHHSVEPRDESRASLLSALERNVGGRGTRPIPMCGTMPFPTCGARPIPMCGASQASRWALLAACLLGFGLLSLRCSDDGSDEGDAAVTQDADGEFALPPPESLLDPATYDCRAADAPPDRASPVPLGCFHDPSCTEPLVVAHRGNPYFAPENTLSAYRSAIAIGADLIELDTRLTADGDLVILHDASVDRTTDATGDADTYTVAELQEMTLKVDVSLPASAEFSCEHIPTLAEALALCQGRIDVMVDLKQGADVAALRVEAAGMKDHAILLGTQQELEEARGAVPDIRVMIRPHASEEVQALYEAFSPAPDVVHIDPGFDEADTIAWIRGLGASSGSPKVLIDVFYQDATAALTGDTSGYLELYDRGIGIEQTQFAFFVVQALGRDGGS